MRIFFSIAFGIMISCSLSAQEPQYVRSVFANSLMADHYFYSEGKFTAPSLLQLQNGKLPVEAASFHTAGNSLSLAYTNGKGGHWEARILLTRTRGRDHFKPATHLSFFINTGSRTIPAGEMPVVRLAGRNDQLGKKAVFTSSSAPGWKRVLVPLSGMFSENLSRLEDVTAIVFEQQGSNGKPCVIGLDDIEFVTPVTGTPEIKPPLMPAAKGYPRHIDLNWTAPADSNIRYVQILRSGDGHNFKPVAVQHPFIPRYTDYVGETDKELHYRISYLDANYRETASSPLVTAKTAELDEDAFLDMIQEAHFRYYWDGAEPNSGLAYENILGRRNMIASGASGFGILALLAGTERQFITREESVERFIRIVNFLEQAQTFHGAFPHFIDGPTGKAEPFFGGRDNGGDLVETSFLLQGLLAARNYFTSDDVREKLIRDKITRIWERVEWSWYRRYPDSKFLFWHWSPDQAWIIDHRLIGWNETMITYFLAIASPSHSVPAGMYYTGWANQDSTGQQYRKNWGGTDEGSMYSNGNTYYGIKLDVGVSNGGPLFFTHYSYMGLDPNAVNDKYTNYFENNRAIARINHQYCVSNPGNYRGYGDSCWGLTASDGPYRYSADEPVPRQDRGKIAPTGAVSSFPYTPVESMKALKNYYYTYGRFLWGEYGFRDAFNLTENWCSGIFMGLNQAPITVMIENYRSGLLWKLFMADKDVQEGLNKLNAETNLRIR